MKDQKRPLWKRDPTEFWRLLAVAMVLTNLVLVYFWRAKMVALSCKLTLN